MRILHTVEFYAPSRGGAQEVVRQVSERLVARGHEVTVATTNLAARNAKQVGGVTIEGFEIGRPGEIERYHSLLRDPSFDVVMNYAAQAWPTDAALPILPLIPAARIMAPCGFSGLYWPQWKFYFTILPFYLRQYDRLIFHSDEYRDISFAREHGLGNFVVVPNGAAAEEFEGLETDFRARHGIASDAKLLLTVGTHTGVKGHRETIKAFRAAAIGRSVLAIIGNRPEGGAGCYESCARRARQTAWRSFGRKRVMLLDPPRAEVVSAYKAADLFVFLSNIECSPIVLFEAAAAGLPFVASDAGNAAEIARWTGAGEIIAGTRTSDGLVAADIGGAARAIERLLGDTDQRRAMAENGRAAWRERFTWDKIAELYEAEYLLAIERRKATPLPQS